MDEEATGRAGQAARLIIDRKRGDRTLIRDLDVQIIDGIALDGLSLLEVGRDDRLVRLTALRHLERYGA